MSHYRIKCGVSGGVTGTREAYLKDDKGKEETFSTLEMATATAAALILKNNSLQAKAKFTYVPEAIRPCRFCSLAVVSSVPTCDFCRECYFLGRTHAEQPRIAKVIKALNGNDTDVVADLTHTGGGCWGLEIRGLQAGRVGFATASIKMQDSTWQTDPTLPAEPALEDPERWEERWGVSINKSIEDFYEAEPPLEFREGLTDEELVKFILERAQT